MRYETYSHRHAAPIIGADTVKKALWDELIGVVAGVTEEQLIAAHESSNPPPMSLSKAINQLLDKGLVGAGWSRQSPIFGERAYNSAHDTRWRLDFAKGAMSVEVAFNHGEAIAWNLIKPHLASQDNHVVKAISTEIGVVVCASARLKEKGAFDNAVGAWDKFQTYLRPFSMIITTPLMFVILDAPETFHVEKARLPGGRGHWGRIVRY